MGDELNPDDFEEEFGVNNIAVDNIFEVPRVPDDDLSDEDEIQHDNVRDNDIDNTPLYFGAEITVRESMLAILSVCLKHNLPSTCLDDIISLVNLHCIRRGLQKNSLYKLKKYFNLGQTDSKKHFYCSSCAQILDDENEVCRTCPGVKRSFFL